MTILGVVKAKVYVLSAECWVMSTECWVMKAECWVLHILDQDMHYIFPKTEAINWLLPCMFLTRGAACWVMCYECWGLSAECRVLSTECRLQIFECLELSAECWALSAGYYNLELLEVAKHLYIKWYAKNGSHKWTTGFLVYYTYYFRIFII